VAGAARGAVVGGDPWRQDRGGVARAGPSVQPVGAWWADDPWRAASGVTPGVPPVVARRVGSRAAARCGRAPGAGDPGDPSVRPVGRGQRMARGDGHPRPPVTSRATVAHASQASCVPTPAPV